MCHVPESMEHILISCSERAVSLIWQLAKDLWPHEDIPWPEPNLGIILGCGSITELPNLRGGKINAHSELIIIIHCSDRSSDLQT